MASETNLAPETNGLTFSIGRPEFIAIVASLMALNALAIDIMLPAFPQISGHYDLTDPNRVQFILLSYVIGFGVAQLVYGPISDRFGRRAPLIFGMALYILFSVAGAFAPTFEFLLASRFIQGLGAAGTRVIALSIVRDTHSGRAMASTMSLVMMVFMAVPAFAPLLGQIMLIAQGWELIFLLMAAICIAVTIWCLRRLPETLPPAKRRALSANSVVSAFHMVLSNRTSLFYMLATALFFGTLFGFLNLAQPIYVEMYGLGEFFPIAFGMVAVIMAGSSFLNSRLVIRFGQRRISHIALLTYCGFCGLLAVLAMLGPVPFWLYYLITAAMMPLFGFVGANLNSIAMEPMGEVAGTASSVLGFSQTVGGGVVGAIIGQAHDGTLFPMASGFLIVSVASIAMILIAEKGRLFSIGPSGT